MTSSTEKADGKNVPDKTSKENIQDQAVPKEGKDSSMENSMEDSHTTPTGTIPTNIYTTPTPVSTAVPPDDATPPVVDTSPTPTTTTTTTPEDPPKDKEMLSFSEWKIKKDMEKELKKEKEKEEEIVDTGILDSTINLTSFKENKIKNAKKLNKKNYASPDCGAKVLDANGEASNSMSILKEDKDAYMLNPCNVQAWVVVELCERIQIDSIDFANFEMFSSTPEILALYVSNRYPAREWEKVGEFHAKPEKHVQNFPLTEKYYAKFVKVKLLCDESNKIIWNFLNRDIFLEFIFEEINIELRRNWNERPVFFIKASSYSSIYFELDIGP